MDHLQYVKRGKNPAKDMPPAEKIVCPKENIMKKIVWITLSGLLLLALPLRAQINLLHEFGGGADDGEWPMGSLVLSGSTFYGMTELGGDYGFGTIFKIQSDGSGFSLLHEFAGGAGDGKYPMGSLIISGSTLYGMTQNGGAGNGGTIFKLATAGTGFTVLHEFAGGAADGLTPMGSLVLSGSTLYGLTRDGGASGLGTIFKIQTDNSGFTLLHTFSGGVADGENPLGSLILSASILYGTTMRGGDSGKGTLFKIGTAGTGYTLLREFAGGAEDGDSPRGDLLLSGSTLYGMTKYGGDGTRGTVFKISTAGTGFTLLREFAGGAVDGGLPCGSLILSGSTLYGMTESGGDGSFGTVFKIATAGTGFSLLHEFAGGATDGQWPDGSLILSNSTLYGMTGYGGSNGYKGVVFSLAVPGITVTAPNGGESWNVGSSHDVTWTSTGTIANVNIDCSTNSGGNWTSVAAGTANDGSYTWTVPNTPSTTCLARVSDAANAATLDTSNAVFIIAAAPVETVSAPSQPTGAISGLKSTGYPFTTGGSTSSLGHALQYKFDWDDGSDSGWLAVGTTTTSHSWAANGTYDVRAMARCVTHTTIESLWSTTHAITISDSGTLEKYNSPAQKKVLPEAIWAPSSGGGTWMSEVQVTDVSGGSQVSVYYSTAAGRRGPFVLWSNGGGALRSQKYANILQTIDGLDSGVFTYYGTVGAVEFVTQDAVHVLQVMARTLNGSYSKTFPGFSVHDSNTADISRVMIVPNLTNNSMYRSTCGLFNPTAFALTMELRLRNAANGQIGTMISKTIAGYGFSAFSPFNDAGVAYPANSYDNVTLEIHPVSGTGKVLCFGASANNATNDPAAHIAVQDGSAHDNGPSSKQILPEAIWAPASGGGTWMSEVQIVAVSTGSVVSVYFDYGAGNRRGPFALWTGNSIGAKVKYANILQQLGTIDTGFTYYGRVGTVEFQTQDSSHYILMSARTLNGNYSKTFPGLNPVDAETAVSSRIMLIQNYTNNITYRSTCGFFNPTADALTVEFTLLNGSGVQIGTPFSKTFVGFDFQAFSPFNESGVAYPANSYDNVILKVRPTSGTGQVICFGASANNASNDPAAHLAVQGQ